MKNTISWGTATVAAATTMTALLLIINPVHADAKEQVCTVFFRATVGGQPAMRPTTIKVMQSGRVVMEIHGHSATTKELTCWGNYTAYFTTTIAEKEVTKTRTFTVLTTTKAIVAMD